MRKMNYIRILTAFVVFLAMACETERITFDGPSYVRFSEESQTLRESYSKIIRIPVHITGSAPASDIVVHYTISGTAREGVDFVIIGDGETVVIKKGEFFGYIDIQLINNANNIIRSQDLVLTLNHTNDSDIQVGQTRSTIGEKYTLTIFDDCILGGTYNGQQSAFSIPTKNIRITSDDCITYTLSNWNVEIFNTPFDMDLTFVDNDDNTLTIPEQEEDILPEEFATIKGSGVVDPVTRVIEFTIVLVDFEDQPEITFTLTPD
jgi:hypothetical protein